MLLLMHLHWLANCDSERQELHGWGILSYWKRREGTVFCHFWPMPNNWEQCVSGEPFSLPSKAFQCSFWSEHSTAHCPLEILRCINVRCSSTRWGQTRRRYFPFRRPDRPLWPTAAPQTLLAPLRFFLIHTVLSVPYSVPLTTHFLVPSILWPPPSWLLFYSISAQLPLPKCKVHRHQSFVVNTVRVKCCPSQLHLHPSSTCTMSDIHDMLRELSLYEAASAAPQSAANSGTAGSQYSLRANKSGKPCRPPPPPPVAQSTSIKKAAIPLPSLGNLSHNSTHSGTQIPFSLVNR